MGPVEVGVGLLPAGGGLTYIAPVAAENAAAAPLTCSFSRTLTEGFSATAMARSDHHAGSSAMLGGDIVVPTQDDLLYRHRSQTRRGDAPAAWRRRCTLVPGGRAGAPLDHPRSVVNIATAASSARTTSTSTLIAQYVVCRRGTGAARWGRCSSARRSASSSPIPRRERVAFAHAGARSDSGPWCKTHLTQPSPPGGGWLGMPAADSGRAKPRALRASGCVPRGAPPAADNWSGTDATPAPHRLRRLCLNGHRLVVSPRWQAACQGRWWSSMDERRTQFRCHSDPTSRVSPIVTLPSAICAERHPAWLDAVNSGPLCERRG